MRKVEEVKIQLFSVEALKLMKKFYTYEKLSSIFKIQPTTLSRYINGHVLPSVERALEIVEFFKEEVFPSLLKQAITVVDEKRKIVSLERVVSDVNLLSIASKIAFVEFKDYKISKILTKEGEGLPFATLLADQLGCDLVVAKSKKDIGVESVIEVKRFYPNGAYSFLYLPKKSIRLRENILIVNDFNRTGSTIRALVDACKKCGSNVVGAVVLVNIQTPHPKFGIKFHPLVEI
ncbi:MAG: helix-turn-helix domain-containing protein [Candidatus Aenigmarchaeota archaeon]|nr:helix-turn-helix domain-containing protein [Candidatus Aenigmarchaeota archaeon]